MASKTTYTFVVYHDDRDVPDNLEHAIGEASGGSMVGAVLYEHTGRVLPDRIRAELLSIGNDGEFFGDDDVFGRED